MLIKNDIKHMNIDAEIKHIIESLNLIIKKIGCNNLLLNNKNTLEDIAFLEIYKNNEQLINADLLCIGEKNNIFGEKISYIGMDVDMLLKIFNDVVTKKETFEFREVKYIDDILISIYRHKLFFLDDIPSRYSNSNCNSIMV